MKQICPPRKTNNPLPEPRHSLHDPPEGVFHHPEVRVWEAQGRPESELVALSFPDNRGVDQLCTLVVVDVVGAELVCATQQCEAMSRTGLWESMTSLLDHEPLVLH